MPVIHKSYPFNSQQKSITFWSYCVLFESILLPIFIILLRADARAEGLPLTVETCHHYLHLHSGQIPARATQYKCCPPIREGFNSSQIYIGSCFKTILENYFSYSFFKPSPRDTDNQELLWEAVLAGHIDMIVSDHSPCTPG